MFLRRSRCGVWCLLRWEYAFGHFGSAGLQLRSLVPCVILDDAQTSLSELDGLVCVLQD